MKKAATTIFCFVHLFVIAQGWQDVSLNIENNLRAVQFIDINHGWIVGDDGIILKYEDGHWIQIESAFSSNNFTGLYFTGPHHGWIIGESGVILNYNYDTLSIVDSPTDKRLNDIFMLNDNEGWIGGNDRTILKYSKNIWTVYPTDNFSDDLGNLKDVQFLDSTFGIFIGGKNYSGFTILNYEDGEWYEDNNPTNTTWLKGLYIKDEKNVITSENQINVLSNWGHFINYNSKTGTHEYIGSTGLACFGCEIDFGETTGWAINGKQIFEYEDGGFVEYENYSIVAHPLNDICMVNDSTGWMVGERGTILRYNPQIANVFVDSNATWNVARTYPNANPQNPDFAQTTTKVFGFNGDTLINNQTWLKFFSSPDSNFLSDFTYLGNLREENGYIFFMDTLHSVDTLYNFNLQIGDAVFYDFGWGTDELHIEHIDSVIINGAYHKRFFIEEPDYPPMFMNEVWIEGIGSVHGPLFPKYPLVFSNEIPDSLNLTCYKIDHSLIWNNPYYDECYVSIMLHLHETGIGEFYVFPNPVTDRLKVKIPEHGPANYVISVFDMFGKSLMKENFSRIGTVEINTAALETGIYIFEVKSENKTVRQKFIKK